MPETANSIGEPGPQLEASSIEPPKQTVRIDQAGLLGLFDLSVLLLRHRLIILSCIGIGLAVALFSFQFHGPYAATTSVLPPQSSINSSLLGQFGSLGGLPGAGAVSAGFSGAHISQDLYVSLLQSNSVQDAFLHRFGLDKEYGTTSPQKGRNLVRGLVEVDGTGRDGLIRITARDANAKRSAELANGYVDEFRHFLEHLAITEAAQRRRFFETQLAAERNNLTMAEESLRKTEQGTGGIEVDAQTRALVESAAGLRGQIAAKQVELQSIRTYAGPQNVNLLRAEQELSELRTQLAKVSNTGNDIDDSLLVSRKDIPQSQINSLRAMRDLRFHESMFQLLSNQYQAARLDEASEESPVQVVDSAPVPELRIGLGRKMKLIYGFFFGLIVGIAFVLLRQAALRLWTEPLLVPKFAAMRSALRPRA